MYEIQLKERIAGYSISPAQGGDMAQIRVSGATSTEDGDLHLKYLEGFPQTVLSMIDGNIQPCDVKSMVVIISKDLKAKVYINEVEVKGIALVKAKKIEKGQMLTRDDISGFERIKISGIDFPEDHAFFCLLPIGWDKVFVFDFSPLDDQTERKIEYDVEKVLGTYFSYLSFRAVHKISDSDWEKILRQGWFPFYALKFETIESIINHAKAEWDIDELLETIEDDALSYIEERSDIWKSDDNLSPYIEFLNLAVVRYNENDFVSSSSIIYPKIEALIRQDFINDNPDKEGRRQNVLVEHITHKTLNSVSALTTFIPDKFKRYLDECYFKDFDSNGLDNQVSRHSVAHGANSIAKFNKKASIVGLLVFSQIAEYLKQSSNNSIQQNANASAD